MTMQHDNAAAVQRKQRSDKGSIALHERDVWALTWIGQQFGVRVDVLPVLLARKSDAPARMLAPGRLAETTTRALVERWQRAGWVEKRKILAGEPAWVYLSRRGVQVLGLGYRAWEPSAAGLPHLHAVNRVRLEMERRYPQATWRSERDLLRAREAAESEAKAAAQTLERRHMPDGEFLVPASMPVAVEVELHAKTQARTLAIMRELATRAAVWYFTDSAATSVVQEARRKLDQAIVARVSVLGLETIP